MSGHNRGKLSKGKGAVDVVLSAGCWSGRSMAFKNGPGVPAKKKRRKIWFDGPPVIDLGGDKFKSSKKSHT